MEFRILGPLQVLDEGRELPLGGAKQRAVLALLLLDPNRVVSRDRLIDEVWHTDPPPTAPTALQVYVSQLRKALGRDLILTQPPGYLLRVPTWPITEPFAPALRRTFASFNAAAINTSISAMSEISGTWLATSCFGRRFSASAAFESGSYGFPSVLCSPEAISVTLIPSFFRKPL